jgi:hypothetical protein
MDKETDDLELVIEDVLKGYPSLRDCPLWSHINAEWVFPPLPLSPSLNLLG